MESFRFLRLDGAHPVQQGELPTMAIYRGADGRWIHLHGALPHLRDGTLRLLRARDEAASIAEAVGHWNSFELEDALARAGQCGAVLRTAAEWDAHPQGLAVAAEPLIALERIGGAPPRRWIGASRPLDGIRVLDLTRILAGPTCARTLAEHGADVLRVSSPRLPDVELFVPDTSHGKRSALLDLDEPGALDLLKRVIEGADVFCQGFRSGSFEARGLGPREVAHLRPGVIYASINAYGHSGPWQHRGGWEQLAQACTGIALEHSALTEFASQRPAVIPAAVCDYCSGHLAALGVMRALLRQEQEGGSWHVRVSLARTAMWLRSQRADVAMPDRPGATPSLTPSPSRDGATEPITDADITRWSLARDTAWGRLTYLGPVAEMSATPPQWALPSAPPGTHPLVWP